MAKAKSKACTATRFDNNRRDPYWSIQGRCTPGRPGHRRPHGTLKAQEESMSKLHSLAVTISLLLLLAGVNGCVPAVRLSAPELAQAQTRIGSVAVGSINNLRPRDTGGENFRTIGAVRSGYGSSLPLNTEEGREVDIAIREALKNALDHAGYFALTPAIPGDVPRLDVDVISFWGDGHKDYRIESVVVVKLVDTASGEPIAQREINLNRGFAVTAGYGSLRQAFDSVMKDLQQEFVSFMLSEPFRIAVRRK
jgi:hypothetical protein